MRTENTAASIQQFFGIFDVDVIDAVGKFQNKFRAVEKLMREMTRVEIDAELGAMINRVQRFARGDKIIRDFRRMHFQAKFDALLFENVQDGIPTRGEILVSFFNFLPNRIT